MAKLNSIKVFAPATVANVGPGYDILGFALEGIGDILEVELLPTSEIKIDPIGGYPELPTDPDKNVVGVAISALLGKLNRKVGFRVTISKNVLPGSGLGSSASSSAAAVFAANELLGRPFSTPELVAFAMEGERAASGKAHADNVAPSILGGFTLVRSYSPLDVVSISYPDELFVSVVHPQIEVKTSDSKKILKREISLDKAVQQWGNVAGLIAGLSCNDYALIGRSLEDVIVEPARSMLIPGFDEAKQAVLNAGALGCSISGSGPSIFALSHGEDTANKVCKVLGEFYTQLAIESKTYLSKINSSGAKVI